MLRRRGGDLSGGQQQQLAIGRALVMRPRPPGLDEPTEGIQPSIIKDIGRVIDLLRQRGEMAILLVEQYFDFVKGLAQRIAVMDRGDIALSGPLHELDEAEVRRRICGVIWLASWIRVRPCDTSVVIAGNSEKVMWWGGNFRASAISSSYAGAFRRTKPTAFGVRPAPRNPLRRFYHAVIAARASAIFSRAVAPKGQLCTSGLGWGRPRMPQECV